MRVANSSPSVKRFAALGLGVAVASLMWVMTSPAQAQSGVKSGVKSWTGDWSCNSSRLPGAAKVCARVNGSFRYYWTGAPGSRKNRVWNIKLFWNTKTEGLGNAYSVISRRCPGNRYSGPANSPQSQFLVAGCEAVFSVRLSGNTIQTRVQLPSPAQVLFAQGTSS